MGCTNNAFSVQNRGGGGGGGNVSWGSKIRDWNKSVGKKAQLKEKYLCVSKTY